jgi:hypothetical protein
MISRIKDRAMEILERHDLPNVTDTAIALNPEFTPAYNVMAIELQGSAGYQVRVIGCMYSLASVPYTPSQEQIDKAAKQALRTLMKGMHDQAVAWLDGNPEEPT